jgi:hypothetical protein
MNELCLAYVSRNVEDESILAILSAPIEYFDLASSAISVSVLNVIKTSTTLSPHLKLLIFQHCFQGRKENIWIPKKLGFGLALPDTTDLTTYLASRGIKLEVLQGRHFYW